MKEDGNPVDRAWSVIIAVERALRSARAAAVVEAKVLQTGKGKSHQRARKDNEEDEVVAFGEPYRVIYLAGSDDEAISRRGGVHDERGSKWSIVAIV